MGIANNGYYTLDDILEHNAQYNIIYSTRSDGKSRDVKKKTLKKSWESGKACLGYVRRNETDIETEYVESYFVDRGDNVVKEVTNGECDFIQYWRKNLYFAHARKGKIERVLKCGKAFALSISDRRYKSTGYNEIDDIIFEEVFTKERYLKDEPRKLQNLVSTIARNDNIKVFMIANTVSRVCPYIWEWGLHNFFKQKEGTIDDYLIPNGIFDENGNPQFTKIAVERPLPSPHKKNSKMFFGNVAKSIQGGSWEVGEHACLNNFAKYEEFEIIYELTYKSISRHMFTIQLLLHKKENYLIVYVYPAKTMKQRVIYGGFSTDYFSTPSLNPENPAERTIHNLIIDNKICYAHNLCAEDFKESLRNETKYPL